MIIHRPPGSNWGDYGTDDRTGRLNELTDERVVRAAAEIRTGRRFCLSLPLDYPGGNVVFPFRHPPQSRDVDRGGGVPGRDFPFSRVREGATGVVNDDVVTLWTQYSTQWDALGHVGSHFDANGDGQAEVVYYNGHYPGPDVDAMATLGLQGRGVLVDLHRQYGDAKVAVSRAMLEDVLRALGDDARAREAADRFKAGKSEEFKVNRLAAKGNQANELLLAGQPAQAAEVYRQMLEIEPGNARTEYNLALALDAAHDPQGEREALERAARLDPKLAVAQGELGRLDMAAGNTAEAEKRLTAAIAGDPQLVSALGNLGVIRAMQGDNEGAEKLFRQAIEDDPNYAQGHLNLGLILAQRQEFTDAEIQLDLAMKLAPETEPAMAAAGKVKARLGKSGEGVALLRKVVALDPHSAATHLDLAIALADSYDLPGALAETAEARRCGSPQRRDFLTTGNRPCG